MTDTERPGLTRRLAEAIVGYADSGITEEALREAERAFVDTVGVAIAASKDETVVTLLRGLDEGGAEGPSRSLVGSPPRSASRAALINGTAGHALDFDDVTYEIQGHPSTVLVPAALAVGEEVGASGRDVLHAYLAGYYAQHLLAVALDCEQHYSLGWHSTATLGVFGSTAASALLYGLDVDQTIHALAIAGSMSSGSRRNFGTMTKPLHAGLAASHGIEAAQLARAGFTADAQMLESRYGFVDLYGAAGLEGVDAVEVPLHSLGEHRLSVKKYPACFNTHRTMDAIIDGAPIDPENVASIAVTLEPRGLLPLIHSRPTTGLEGKFSLQYTAAVALTDRNVVMATFTDEAVNRPELQALLRKVKVAESATPPFGATTYEVAYSCVEVTLNDGSVQQRRTDHPRGYGQIPLSDQELLDKFADCLTFATGEAQEDLWKVLNSLRELANVRDLPAVTHSWS